jgi:hypothetical protein
MFNAGDMCYIPQGVQLWTMGNNGYNITHTENPTTAVFLEEKDSFSVLLFVNGQKLLARKSHVYPWIETEQEEVTIG